MGAVSPNQALAAKELPGPAKGVERIGHSSPLGATIVPGGVNFSIFSRNASGMELLLFDGEDDSRPRLGAEQRDVGPGAERQREPAEREANTERQAAAEIHDATGGAGWPGPGFGAVITLMSGALPQPNARLSGTK